MPSGPPNPGPAVARSHDRERIAPSTELRRWFGHDPQRWAEFNRRYRQELEVNPVAVAELATLLHRGPSTLLYAARDEQHTLALVLAGFMAEHR